MTDKVQKIREEVEKLHGNPYYMMAVNDVLEILDMQEVHVSEVWHDADETPKGDGDKKILVQFTDSHASVLEIDDWEYLDHQTKWAYLKDLT